MGRRPSGERAMTAERQRKRRERLGIGGPVFAATRPWDGTLSDTRRETETIERITDWLENGDINAVTEWLVEHFATQADKDEGVELIRQRWERMDAERLEADKLRLAEQGIRYSDEMTDEEFERLRRRADELRRQADEET
jgi:hypothetical protein